MKLDPSSEQEALRQLHLEDNNCLNPDGTGWVVRSWLELDDTPDQSVFILREDKAAPTPRDRRVIRPNWGRW